MLYWIYKNIIRGGIMPETLELVLYEIRVWTELLGTYLFPVFLVLAILCMIKYLRK